jgi:Transglutaminase-like superfamily
MNASYFLSPHVHVCVAGKHVVFLDLERDKYLALAHTHPVGRWVRGWPVPPPDTTPTLNGADSQPAASGPEDGLLAKMISQGLLVTDPPVGKEAAPVVAEPPKLTLVEDDLNVRPRTTFAHLRHLLIAYTAAKWSLKHRSIRKVVQAAALRKSRAPSASAPDVGRVRTLVAAFIHLRPLFFTVRNACLLDSLTLVNFLAGYGFFPQWVFGVETDPFYAHCWVQEGDFVFNDTPDYVRGFSPILVV